MVRALLFVVGILERAKIGGLRVERIEQAVERAARDLVHVGVVHVVALNVLEHFTVNRQGVKRFVIRSSRSYVAGRDIRHNQNRHRDHDFSRNGIHSVFLDSAVTPRLCDAT